MITRINTGNRRCSGIFRGFRTWKWAGRRTLTLPLSLTLTSGYWGHSEGGDQRLGESTAVELEESILMFVKIRSTFAFKAEKSLKEGGIS